MLNDIAKIKNILVAVPDRLGDTLFCTQSLRFLKEKLPRLNIDILAPTKLAAAVFEHNPYVENIYILSSPTRYDLKIDISDSEIIQQYIAATKNKWLVYQDDKNLQLHSAEKLLGFFAGLFKLEIGKFARHYDLFPQQRNFENIENMLRQQGVKLDQDILIGLHIGCHGLARKRTRWWRRYVHRRAWPIKKFIKLAQKLQTRNPNLKIVLTGSQDETDLGVIFERKISNTINLITKTPLLDLAALMSYIKIFVCNDTGVMHVACAADINIIALFGADNPIINYPYPSSDKRVILRGHKIADIAVGDVLRHINVI